MMKLAFDARVLVLAATLLAACATTSQTKTDDSAGKAPEPTPAANAATPAEPVSPPAEVAPAAPAEPAAAPAAGDQLPPEVVSLSETGDFPLEPPGGRWSTDENGDQYFILKVPRQEGGYMFIDEHSVRLRYGMTLRLASYDDTTFYAKIFKTSPDDNKVRRNVAPTVDELARVAATYKVDIRAGGNLRLEPFEAGLPQRGQWRNGFVLADMNGDRLLDIVHSPPRKGFQPPPIFLGDGKGGWKQWATKYPSLRFDYGDVQVADFNRDGKQDLALAMHVLGVAVLLGDGKGGFTNWSQGLDYNAGAGMGTGYSSRSLVTVDWNGDRLPDVLTLGEGMGLATTGESGATARSAQSYGVVLYLNRGDGTWQRQDQGNAAQQIFGDAVVLGDFDRDGRTDFATAAQVVGRRDLVNLHQADGSWSPVEIPGIRDRAFIHAVAAADFDRDGATDLAVSYQSFELSINRSGIDVFLSRGSGANLTWERRALAAREGRDGWTALTAGDLDGDGASDLVAVSVLSDLDVFRGDGKGAFSRLMTDPAKATDGCRGFRVAIADLDGDGATEMVANFAGESSSAQTTLFRAIDLPLDTHCRGEGALRAWRVAEIAGASRD